MTTVSLTDKMLAALRKLVEQGPSEEHEFHAKTMRALQGLELVEIRANCWRATIAGHAAIRDFDNAMKSDFADAMKGR